MFFNQNAIKKHTSIKRLKKEAVSGVFFAFLLISSLFVSLFPQTASATSLNQMTLDEQSHSYVDVNTLALCIQNAPLINGTLGSNLIEDANAKSGQWFGTHGVFSIGNSDITKEYGYLTGGGLGNKGDRVDCNNLVTAASTLWGYTSPIDLLCSFAQRQNNASCLDTLRKEPFEINDPAAAAAKFYSVIKNRIYSGQEPVLTPEIKYFIYSAAFFADKGCSAKPLVNGTLPSGAPAVEGNGISIYSVKTVVSTPSQVAGDPPVISITSTGYYGLPGNTSVLAYFSYPNNHNVMQTCRQIADGTDTNANSARQYYIQNTADAVKTPQAADCTTDPSASGCAAPTTSSCAIDGIGWIVCPVMTFLGTVSDNAYSFIAGSFLNINVKLLSPTLPDGSTNPTFSTWGTFRNIANVLFVIVFLMIVFSQLTSFGISSYGVKKMLPRLVIAAILVNASYYIVQIAVDVSNILGYSLKSLFDALPIYAPGGTANGLQQVGEGLTWAVLLVGVLGAAVGIALAISAPVLLAALLSALMIVLILIGRQAIIVILVIISPLAFVAWLLPNTEQWFKKWWKMFFSLLMVFPVIGVLFGASKMAATVMQAVGASSGDTLLSVIALGVATIPLIMTPTLLKGSLQATGALGAKLNGLSSKANSRLGGKVKDTSRLGEVNKSRQLGSMRRRAEKRTNPSGWQSKLDNSGIGRKLGFNAGAARASQITDAADQEEMKNAHSMLSNIRIGEGDAARALTQSEKMTLAKGSDVIDGATGKTIVSAKNGHMRRAAIEQAGSIASVNEAHELLDASSGMDATTRKTLSTTMAQSSAVKKAPWLGGKTLEKINRGVASSDDSIKDSIINGGVTAESMLGGDEAAILKLQNYALTTAVGSPERGILKAAVNDLRTNANYQGRVTAGSKHDLALSALTTL